MPKKKKGFEWHSNDTATSNPPQHNRQKKGNSGQNNKCKKLSMKSWNLVSVLLQLLKSMGFLLPHLRIDLVDELCMVQN